MAKKSYTYQGHVFEDNGHGDLYNGEVDRFLIFRPYPMMVQTVMHKDDSVTMSQEKFKENTDKNQGVYEEGYEVNEDGSVFVKAEDVDPKIKEESEDNKNTSEGQEVQNRFEKEIEPENNEFDQEHDEGFYSLMNTGNYSDEQGNAVESYERGKISYDDLVENYFDGDGQDAGQALHDFGSNRIKEETIPEINAAVEKDNVQHEYTSYFTLESPLGDIDAAQEYLSEDNMAQYLDGSLKDKVDSIDWVLDDDQSGHIEIKTNSTLTDEEQQELEDWIDGQNSDGLGEGFEQQDFANAYFNPDDGDGPFTYGEAEVEIDNIIENVDNYDAFDYIDESEIEAAVDTYLEDNDLITEFKDNYWDSVKDELFSYCSTDQIVEAAETIKGDELTDEEMDLVYDNFDSDPDYKEEIAQELWQNLATDEQGEVINALDEGETLREEARDAIRDDLEGYIPDDVIYEAKRSYAGDHYYIDIDDWGTMSSIRRSVDGLQDKVIEPEGPLIDRINEEIANNYDSMQTTWRDWVNENLDRDKTPSKIAQDYQKVMDNINQEINSYDNDDRFDIADSYLERNGFTEKNGYDTTYLMRLRNGIIESLHIDEHSNPRDFGVTDEDIKLANEYDIEHNRRSWSDIKSDNLQMTKDDMGSNNRTDEDELLNEVSKHYSNKLDNYTVSEISMAFNDMNDSHAFGVNKAVDKLLEYGEVVKVNAGNPGTKEVKLELSDGNVITLSERSDGTYHNFVEGRISPEKSKIYNEAMEEYQKYKNNDVSFNFNNESFEINIPKNADKLVPIDPYNAEEEAGRIISDRYIVSDPKYTLTNNLVNELKRADNYSRIDLKDNYELEKRSDNSINIISNKPDGSEAIWTDMNNTFSIYDSNGKLIEVVGTVDEAIDRMKKLDMKIRRR